jgi:hypothetical protein
MPQKKKIPFIIIYADAPEILLFELSHSANAAFLVIRRTLPVALCQYEYLIEDVYLYRKEIKDTGVPYRNYRDGDWPEYLTEVPGLWQYPLRTTFPNLTFLDLSIQDATLWLMPILNVTDSGVLRRVFIRSCVDWGDQVLPFPFEALDQQLSIRPAAKLLIGWAYGDKESDCFISVFRNNLPRLTISGRLGILFARGSNCKYFFKESLYEDAECIHPFLQRFWPLKSTWTITQNSGSLMMTENHIPIHMPRVILMSIHGSTTQTKTHWDRSQYLNCTYHQ